MNGWKIGALVFLAALGLTICSIVDRGCGTASRMADKTVFNADKHVWSYEEFHRKASQYDEYRKQRVEAERQLAELGKQGVTSGQRYDNLATELDGVSRTHRGTAFFISRDCFVVTLLAMTSCLF